MPELKKGRAMKTMAWFLSVLVASSLSAAEWRVDLEGACSTQHMAQVYLDEKDGVVVKAFALAPTFNKAWGRVEATALRRQGETWQGRLVIELPSDGWQPAPGTCVRVEADLATDAGGVLCWSGRRDGGAAGGAVSVHALKSNEAVNPLLMSLAVLQGNPTREQGVKPRTKNLQMRMALGDDRAEVVILREQASPVDTSNDIVVTRQDIRRRDGEWRGQIEADVRYQLDRRVFPWAGRLEMVVLGDMVAGTLVAISKDGGEAAPLLVTGSVLPASTVSGRALVMPLVLNGALPNGGNLECYLEFDGGRVVAAFATGPNANNATHVVDAKDLCWENGGLWGTLGVVLQADSWMPADRLPVPVIVKIEATVDHAAVRGRFTGQRGSQAIMGTVAGVCQSLVAKTPPVKATIKFEDGLLGAGDKAWLRRAFVGVTLDAGGRVTGGKVSNNHSKLSGVADGGFVRCTAGRLEGELNLTVWDGNVTAGGYHFRFEGPLVGEMATGIFELLGEENEVLKTGSFWATLQQ